MTRYYRVYFTHGENDIKGKCSLFPLFKRGIEGDLTPFTKS